VSTLAVTGLTVFGISWFFKLAEKIRLSKSKPVQMPQQLHHNDMSESDDDLEMNNLGGSKSLNTFKSLYRRPISRSPSRSPRPRPSKPVLANQDVKPLLICIHKREANMVSRIMRPNWVHTERTLKSEAYLTSLFIPYQMRRINLLPEK
jgi:hypothetical protein